MKRTRTLVIAWGCYLLEVGYCSTLHMRARERETILHKVVLHR